MLKVNHKIAIPMSEFRWEFARSSGPGGQNVNKVQSKAVLRWNPRESRSLPEDVRARLIEAQATRLNRLGELLVSSQRTRDQGRNMDDCLEKVRRLVLAAAVPPKVRRATRPTAASQERRVEAKLKRSHTKRLRRAPPGE
jgi:ribosome-associated protein